MKITVIFGGPGVGKSTWLANKYKELLTVYKPKDIVFVSYTRKQTSNGLKKVKKVTKKRYVQLKDSFRTVHSMSRQSYGTDTDVLDYVIVDRMSDFLQVDMTPVVRAIDYMKNVMSDNDAVGANRAGLDTKTFQKLKLFYNSVKEGYKKRGNAKIDYADMIEHAARFDYVSKAKVVMLDECFSPDTKVRMADMSVKAIKDIKIGEYVMGTQGPTKVIKITVGRDRMFNVGTGVKNVLFTCNSRHLIQQYVGNKHQKWDWTPVGQLTCQPKFVNFQCTDYKENNLCISPYFLGLWLGNGFSREAVVVCNKNDSETINWLKDYGEQLGDKVLLRERTGIVQIEYSVLKKGWELKCEIRKRLEKYGFLLSKTKANCNRKYKEKRIPFEFMQSSRKQRLELLAGIIDSDGMYVGSGACAKMYRIEMARKALSKDIYNLVGSLGFNPTFRVTQHTTNGIKRVYYRVDFYGSEEIPCLIPRKQFLFPRKSRCLVNKGKQRTVWVKEDCIGDYVGITVDADDNLFLLENGCVVHNCQDFSTLQWQAIYKVFRNVEEMYVAGDPNQALYRFSGGNSNYMFNIRCDETVMLSQSRRCCIQVMDMATLVWKQIKKSAEMPLPTRQNGFAVFSPSKPTKRLLSAFVKQQMLGQNIMVLANTYYQLLEVERMFLAVYPDLPHNFIAGRRKEYYHGKEKHPIIFSTVHQAKGLEAQFILYDVSYGRSSSKFECTTGEDLFEDFWKTLYTGITRARQGIVLFQLSTPLAGEPNCLDVLYYANFGNKYYKRWLETK